MSDPRTRLDRRAFLELATAGAVVATAGVTAVACQSSPGDSAATPIDAPRAGDPATMWIAPLRAAIVPDDVAPAMEFHPLRRPSRP